MFFKERGFVKTYDRIILGMLCCLTMICVSAYAMSNFDTTPYQQALAHHHKDATRGRSVLDHYCDELLLHEVAYNPEAITDIAFFERFGVSDHNAYLNDCSPSGIMQAYRSKQELYKKLTMYACTRFLPEEAVSFDVCRWDAEHALQGEKFLFHEYKVNQMFGVVHNITYLLTVAHALENQNDVYAYLSRLESIAKQFAQTEQLLEYQYSRAIVPPAFALEKVITNIDKFIQTPVCENIFYIRLHDALASIRGIDADLIAHRAQIIIETSVYPAYRSLQMCCKKLLQATQGVNNGVWALPDGDAYYDYMLEHRTTTRLSAEEVHALGHREVEKIHTAVRALLFAIGYDAPDKSVGQLLSELRQDSRFYFANTSEGRQQCLASFYGIVDQCRTQLYQYFNMMPKAELRICVTPAHEQDGQPAAYYYAPSLDGSRPGMFFVNLRDMNEVPQYCMETLTVHEAVPGHHFQMALQNEMNLPLIRKMKTYTAYAEGWALYVEKLAYEQNFYSKPVDQIGHFSDELLRAARLVVDTGIHRMRWTREQAIEYMSAVTGMHPASVATEVERYFVMPGQACSYKIGQLKILELRKLAQDSLGDAFDIRAFHDVVLNAASVPMEVLEKIVRAWIDGLSESSFS